MAQIPAREVGVVDRIVLRDGDAPRPRRLVRQRVLRDLQRLGIDAADVGRVELVEERNFLGVQHDAVRPRVGSRRRIERDLAALRIERADEVAGLHRKVHEPGFVERHRVRIARLRIRHLVLGDLFRLRIDPADQSRRVAGVPDVAVLVRDHAVRTGVRRRQRELLELLCLRIEAADDVRFLSRVPDGAVRRDGRIVRIGRIAGRQPLVDLHVDRVGDRHGVQERERREQESEAERDIPAHILSSS